MSLVACSDSTPGIKAQHGSLSMMDIFSMERLLRYFFVGSIGGREIPADQVNTRLDRLPPSDKAPSGYILKGGYVYLYVTNTA